MRLIQIKVCGEMPDIRSPRTITSIIYGDPGGYSAIVVFLLEAPDRALQNLTDHEVAHGRGQRIRIIFAVKILPAEEGG
jgi:hypothetical protein